MPIAGLGAVPLLIEVAARLEAGTLDPLESVDRSSADAVATAGMWRNPRARSLPLVDLAVLCATASDDP